MKRRSVAFVLIPSALLLGALAASCSAKPDATAKKPASKYYAGKDAGGPEAGAIPDAEVPGFDPDATAALLEMQKDIKTIPHALSALLTSYDIAEKEANIGKAEATTPPMQAYVHDLLEDIKTSRSRLRQLAAAKEVTPRSTNLNSRLKFESQAALMNLANIYQNMFNSAFMARRVESERSLLRLVEEQLEPVMSEDEDFKEEIRIVHGEVEQRLARAETVKTGLTDGIGGLDDGMFEEIERPQAPQAPKPVAEDPPKDAGN